MTASKATHTPGPWKAVPTASGYWKGEFRIESATRTHSGIPLDVALVRRINAETVSPQTADGESDANASLIAAAPDLLAILTRIIHRATTPLSDGGIDWDDVTAARAIIAKAEGK